MHQARSSRSDQQTFAWHLGLDDGGIADARLAFETWLARTKVLADDVSDMAVVLSELASTAAGGAAPGTLPEIRAELAGTQLQLEVLNQVDRTSVEISRWDLDDPLRGGGRGLLIVRAYTDSVQIDTVDGAVRVRCSRQLEASG